ncbi:OpgC domain-containing protein [Vibrio sp. 404]|uniref:OpgC domain-containing protein n=1 Tax=Vibrio marinisediminis TaxID=2758441 RepID=A0A7W2IUX1_9VIBR|nr:OpgC domain-containing protein [Vibrio marinisediminis]MBA5763748.1 OpgC domain-containing protein [Vibrio marinisediminis]
MKRIPALDSIRGLLLIVMTLNHLFWISGGNSIVQFFTLQPFGQFGAAECFILVSGFLAGAIYSREKLSNAEVKTKAWGRALTIFRYHIVCLAIVFVWFALCSAYLPWAMQVIQPNLTSLVEAPWSSTVLSALLINKPNYLEILPLYIMYMLLLPALVAAYRRGWMIGVIVISTIVWSMSGSISDSLLLGLLSPIFPDLALQTGYFDPFAWQFLFVVASAFGYAANQANFRWYSATFAVGAAIIAVIFLCAHHGTFTRWGLHQGILYSLADKPELGWFRVLNIAIWAYLTAVLIRIRPNWLVFRPLSYIGRHSLQVFAWHTVMIYLMAPMLMSQRFEPHYEWLVFLCAASIWIPVWMREHSEHFSTTKRWSLGGGGAITVALMLSLTFTPEAVPVVEADSKGLAPLSVKIENIQGDGAVVILVYAEEDNLMGMPSIHAQGYSPQTANSGVVIEGIPVGKYAIFAFQDDDNDNQLTMGPSGMPVEGFGYSNNPALQGPPNKAQIQFAHPDKAHQTIQLVNF